MNLRYFLIIIVLLLVSGLILGQDMPLDIEIIPYPLSNASCTGQFITHTLDHITTVPSGDDVHMFEANGAGVGINDLDNDGDLDIVLANHGGLNTILWNEGNLSFRTERMAHGDSRAVNIVDVDGDGWQDIIFTRTASAPNFWRNRGADGFQLELLPGVAEPLYTISWADLDSDGDLDLVGGTYDAGLLTDLGQEFLLNGRGGVYYYENENGFLRPTRLMLEAQALALVLVDLNGDNRLDILVGNDFAVPDYIWYRTDDGWESGDLFPTFSHSTMSYDFGDINNDGLTEIFSTDMRPYISDDETMAAWQPIMESMMDAPHDENDPQIMANTLQVLDSRNVFADQAVNWGVDATGWSWSSKFGDFDQDGFLDLYAVNGMIEYTVFAHLPNHELVEENQAFRNNGTGHFEPMPAWGLASTASGRGMSMGDLDGDGDLDIVVNNLRGAAQLFENQLCEGSSLQVDLRWPDSGNTSAIGAMVTLYTSTGTYYRQVRAASGYLSGDPARLHFGFPERADMRGMDIRWPDGAISSVDTVERGAFFIIRTDSD